MIANAAPSDKAPNFQNSQQKKILIGVAHIKATDAMKDSLLGNLFRFMFAAREMEWVPLVQKAHTGKPAG